MQTALSIRETVMKLMDVFVYVVVYFVGTVVLVAQADVWLVLPLVVWLASYLVLVFHFVPRLQKVSMAQSDARAQMTGRIVDSYTNIQTIKLFAHTMREQDYAPRRHGRVHGHRARADAAGHPADRQPCIRSTPSCWPAWPVWRSGAWLQASISMGAIAVAIALVMRIRSMSDWILWEVASLFENIGTVEDGMGTLAQPLAIARREGRERPGGRARRDPLSTT